jgi:hypothetical protein
MGKRRVCRTYTLCKRGYLTRICDSDLTLRKTFLVIIVNLENLELHEVCQIPFEICFLRSKECLLVSEF